MTTTAPTAHRFATEGSGRTGTSGPGGTATDGDKPAAAKPKKGLLKNKKFLIALVAVLVVGGVGYKMFAPKHAAPPTGGDVVAMDPTTLNLQDGHYLKLAIAVQLVKGKASATDFMSSKAAELTIDEFSDRTVESLSSNPARKRLVADLRDKIKAAYPGEVYDIFLTQFVTQ
jgi:flagellar FliL protein